MNKSNKLKNIKVICFGGGEFSDYEIKKYKLRDNFINYQGDDYLLSNLYKGAIAFINTSKYEGFGITNVEAMSLGCPVISSNFATFREVNGNSCLYFKNNNYLYLINKMIYFLEKKKRNIYINRGYKRSKMFTWAKCSKHTKYLYKNLIKN